jgi:hypothetical protein
VDMLQVNRSIHTILLRDYYEEHEMFRTSVIPYLETNRLRPRLLAIQKTRPIPYRAKVLGRALLAVRADVNSFWMLLSGNAEVAFPSTTAVVANLSTPAAADVADVAPVVAAAASNIVAPAAGQKRKACSYFPKVYRFHCNWNCGSFGTRRHDRHNTSSTLAIPRFYVVTYLYSTSSNRNNCRILLF